MPDLQTAIADAEAARARHESQHAGDPFHFGLDNHLYVALDRLLSVLKDQEQPEWEYVPGHISPKHGPFVQNGVVAPGYVRQYIAQGGEVLRRRVGPWQQYNPEGETDA